MPEGQGYVLPDDVPALHGAFCEPIGCCLHAVDVARIAPGDSVVVLGGGVIGMLMVQLVQRAGAGTVVLSTRQAPRRALAERLGAKTVDASGDVVAAITGPGGLLPGGADVVIECAGVAETFAQAPRLARRGGAVVVFGVMAQGEAVPMLPYDLLVKELRIESAWLNPLTHGRAAQLVAERALELDALITRTVPLGDVAAILAGVPASARSRRSRCRAL